MTSSKTPYWWEVATLLLSINFTYVALFRPTLYPHACLMLFQIVLDLVLRPPRLDFWCHHGFMMPLLCSFLWSHTDDFAELIYVCTRVEAATIVLTLTNLIKASENRKPPLWISVLFCASFLYTRFFNGWNLGCSDPMLSEAVKHLPPHGAAQVVRGCMWGVHCVAIYWGGLVVSGLIKAVVDVNLCSKERLEPYTLLPFGGLVAAFGTRYQSLAAVGLALSSYWFHKAAPHTRSLRASKFMDLTFMTLVCISILPTMEDWMVCLWLVYLIGWCAMVASVGYEVHHNGTPVPQIIFVFLVIPLLARWFAHDADFDLVPSITALLLTASTLYQLWRTGHQACFAVVLHGFMFVLASTLIELN